MLRQVVKKSGTTGKLQSLRMEYLMGFDVALAVARHADAELARAREGAQGLWAACTLLPDGRVAPASSGP